MRKLELLTIEEQKEVEEREYLIDPFMDSTLNFKLGHQKSLSPRVLELLNYKIARRSR